MKRRKRLKTVAIVVLLLALMVPLGARAAGEFGLLAHIVAGGGGRSTGNSIVLEGTIGQPATIRMGGGKSPATLFSGMWSARLTPPEGAVFADVPEGYWAFGYVSRLYWAGVTGGCAAEPLQYCPGGNVTRAQMAAFLERGMHGANTVPPEVEHSSFGDVPDNYWAKNWIEALYNDGITSGCGGGNFCPGDPVTRAQMAMFLLRAEHGPDYAPPQVDHSRFNDIPDNFWAKDWIEQLAAEGITGGCGGGNYCPGDPVTRAQMAVFLVRAFNLP